MDYATLMMDIHGSRGYSVPARKAIQVYIQSVLESLNHIFKTALAKPVTFSAGDEVQGLFTGPEAAYLYLRLFAHLLFPVRLFAGLGYGKWNIRLMNYSSSAQDGPVYHQARQALEDADKNADYPWLFLSGKSEDIIINTTLSSQARALYMRSVPQNEVFLLLEMISPLDAGGLLAENLAERLLKANTSRKDFEKEVFLKKDAASGLLSKTSPNDFVQVSKTDAISADTGYFVTLGEVRGAPGRLAEISGTTRQNIGKIINAAGIYRARNADISLIKLMHSVFGENVYVR